MRDGYYNFLECFDTGNQWNIIRDNLHLYAERRYYNIEHEYPNASDDIKFILGIIIYYASKKDIEFVNSRVFDWYCDLCGLDNDLVRKIIHTKWSNDVSRND